jgi:hypothetical protein
MQKKETDSQEREKTLVLSQIRKLDETIATIKSTRLSLNKRRTELSGILREQMLSKKEKSNGEAVKMYTTLSHYVAAEATLLKILGSFQNLQTELKNNLT